MAFAQRRFALPIGLFAGLAILWLALIAVALAVPTPIALFLTLPIGGVIGLLFIVGHDACHNSLTGSTPLNHLIGRLAFLPSLHAFSLWDLSHNRTHHRFNNIEGLDHGWVPMSPQAYRDASGLRRLGYRITRTPLGVGLFYLFGLWLPRLFVPLPWIVGATRRVYWLDSALVLAFLVAQIVAVLAWGGGNGKSAVESLAVGIVLPFLVWNAMMSFIIFLHHTHPAVRWYRTVSDWRADQGALRGTVHVRFPGPVDSMVLSIMEHNAHHLTPGVPLYNLSRMQTALEDGNTLIVWRFSWRAYVRICRVCKLYDYDAQRWVGYDAVGA